MNIETALIFHFPPDNEPWFWEMVAGEGVGNLKLFVGDSSKKSYLRDLGGKLTDALKRKLKNCSLQFFLAMIEKVVERLGRHDMQEYFLESCIFCDVIATPLNANNMATEASGTNLSALSLDVIKDMLCVLKPQLKHALVVGSKYTWELSICS